MYVSARPPLTSGSFDSLGSSDASRMKVFVLNGATTRFLIYTENEDGSKNLEEQILNLAHGKLRLKNRTRHASARIGSFHTRTGREMRAFLSIREVEGSAHRGELGHLFKKRNRN
jgi:hypothetical protein